MKTSTYCLAKILISAIAILCLIPACDDDGSAIVEPPPAIPPSAAIAAWSPTGEWIAVSRLPAMGRIPRGVYLIRPDGSEFRQFPGLEGSPYVIDLCWSPDGQWLAFITGTDVYKIKIDGDSLTRLTFNGENYACTWSNSDTLIAFRHSPGDTSSGAWIMDQNGENARQFIRYGGHLDFGPADSLFYIISIGNNRGKLALMNLADSTERIVLVVEYGKPYHAYYMPDVSPDGLQIAFCLDAQIRILDIAGGNITTLTENGGDHPSWSPDGSKMVYCDPMLAPGHDDIIIMNADGSDPHVLLDWDTAILTE